MDIPIRACETEHITPDTHLTRLIAMEGVLPNAAIVNSLVITGAEPVVVDTGPAIARDLWLDATFSVVNPADVRWIYLSHDDHDHTGNLLQVLDLCPAATLVTTQFMAERLLAEFVLPLERMRWVNDGDSFHAGDRELVAVQPPVFDSPTTRGLFDATSGVYWSADAFATLVPKETLDVSELGADLWRENFLQSNRMLSPWHRWLDPTKYGAHLDRIRSLGATAVASAHSPTLHDDQIVAAIDLLRELPTMEPVVPTGQAELELILSFLIPA